MKKIVVTGADGMLGSNICRELVKQGYHIKALCLPETRSKTLNEMPVHIVYGNILDVNFLQKELEGYDAVIHTAALTTVWPRHLKEITEVNYQGTLNVAEAVTRIGLQRMVHIGTANSFGYGSKESPGDENSIFNSGKFKIDYIKSKFEAQNELLDRFKKNGLPVIIINPTFMIGPYDTGPSSGQMLLRLYNKSVPAYSKGGRNFVCAADVACAAVNALKMGKIGECYIAGNENLEYRQFFKKACDTMNRSFKMYPAPQVLILLLGGISSLLARLTGKPPKISFTMARIAAVDQFYSSAKAVRELKMPQTPVESGMRQCLDWFEENGYLQ